LDHGAGGPPARRRQPHTRRDSGGDGRGNVPRESNQYQARIEGHATFWGIPRFDRRPPARTGEAPGGPPREAATLPRLGAIHRVSAPPASRVGRNAACHWWLTEPRCRPVGKFPYATAVDSVGVLLEAERNRARGCPSTPAAGGGASPLWPLW